MGVWGGGGQVCRGFGGPRSVSTLNYEFDVKNIYIKEKKNRTRDMNVLRGH